MFSRPPGVVELLVILFIVLLLFGAGKLPEIGSALGKGIREFRRSTTGEDPESQLDPLQTKVTEETKT